VHFDLLPRPAWLALIGHEPLDDLAAVALDAGGVVVERLWRGVWRQGDASPSRDQRRFPVPVHRDLKAPTGSVPGVEDGTVAAVDLRDADPS